MDLMLQLLQQQYQNENKNKDKKFIEYLDANIRSYERKMMLSKNPIERERYKRHILNMMSQRNSLSTE